MITVDKQLVVINQETPVESFVTVTNIELVKAGCLGDGTPYSYFRGVYTDANGVRYNVKSHTYHDNPTLLWWVGTYE